MALRDERCPACTASTPKLTPDELAKARGELSADWNVTAESTRLRRTLRRPDFAAAFALATRVALIAEGQGHHPDLTIGWGRLEIEITTHAVGGLTRSDVVLAAHIDAALE